MFICSNLFSQKGTFFENKNLKITIDKGIDSSRLWVSMYQISDKSQQLFDLFPTNEHNNEIFYLPDKSGFYT